ncbi:MULTISPECIES: GNAT family N-acetyltransferase [Curtobacterium]|jgi:GNAT superfamily N-acetyltransferase|uniref:GNAT family N-acetyltransferase n=1 Tax=Curtobacterium TaxID=2034 RepID=UPI0013CF7C0B|nr:MULTISPECIES: GNAT family N-acetyltransferase [Curtobacterium]MCS6547595.1 GNAT family N-acetyltransferase [Curtobacterium flaccumfaciens pv. flaccumfaciens]MCS6581316.1 GNAT family N-acetyltransferase [Curtobacterium flaccumfaciens pv. beticola]MCS6587413.1 GNAT family N-acetyltransferase [Curtobacterium flaccumfaciens pv. flaccumfaciens]QFS79885.2 GNAT family N-acetyltransferase [Curtobacterium flaccumfaciens pv. flaccumfaciens]WIE59755.1 GNAT family N-acetyltransferase [Curtobacterium sp
MPEASPNTISIEVEHFDSPDAQRLRAAQRLEIDRAHGGDTEPGEKPTAESIAVFFVARDESGTPLGCGGLRIVDDGIAEIKRMYVRPESRGSGAAAALLRRLEEAALDLGSPALVLETGTEQQRAVGFYQREGFRRIANFGPYVGAPLSVCYSKVL